MQRTTGSYVKSTTAGEVVQAFVPRPLPPARPALTLDGLRDANLRAELALARLSGGSGLVPSADWLLHGAIRTDGDWEGWLAFFFEGIAASAEESERTIIALASRITADRRRLLDAPRATPASYRLFEQLPLMPRFSVEQVRERLQTTFPTAGAAVRLLEEIGIVTERTGQRTHRLYSYQAYVDLLTRQATFRGGTLFRSAVPARLGQLPSGRGRRLLRNSFLQQKAERSLMRNIFTLTAMGSLVLLAACTTPSSSGPGASSAAASSGPMSFFITSVGPGKGGDLGGLEGADKHCQSLAQAAGQGNRPWRAYLSTQAPALNSPAFVNARDRIGKGPWHNAKGVLVARNVDELHSDKNNITKETGLDERGRPVNGRTEQPNKHDILTGSRPDGTAFVGGAGGGQPFPDMTCGNWTKSTPEGSAMIGHFDRAGPIAAPWATSWNSSHPTVGCSLERIRPTGGDGLLYCFAAN